MLEFMKYGGPAMWLILAVSLISAYIFLERLFHLHRAQINTDDFLHGIYNVLKMGNVVEAISICDETPGPAAYLVRNALLNYDEGRTVIEKAVTDAGRLEIPRMERNITLLGTFAQIAPLIGLFGTVLGMIDVFILIQQKSPLIHAGDLSGGMWEALMSTAAGLLVGILAYTGYNFLVGRLHSLLGDMERTASEIVHFLVHEKQ